MGAILFIHSFVFILFWLTNQAFSHTINEFLAAAFGARLDFVLICLGLSALALVWSGVRLLVGRRGRPVGGRWLFRIVAGVYLLFFYASFLAIFLQQPAQLTRLGQMVGFFRLPVDLLLLFGLAWLLRPLVNRPAASRLARLAPGAALVLFWLGALLVPPQNVTQGALPPRPRLVAHRGASQLAPENTLAAARLAAPNGAYGLEGDIRVSLDGVLFLMHDATLTRTTDVAAVFPGRAKERAENFTWAELQRLNAGTNFSTPEPIPLLADVLQVVRESKLVFIFDLLAPPAGHPYGARLFELCFQQLKTAGVDSQIWLLGAETERAAILASAPQMKLAAGLDSVGASSPALLLGEGYAVVNSDFGLAADKIQAYRGAGLWVNLYTVDEPWMFDRLWLLGVDSVATNSVQVFSGLQRPIYVISYPEYLLIWAGIGIAGLSLCYYRGRRKIS